MQRSRPTPQVIVITKLLATRKNGKKMSNMSNLSIEIGDMLESGYLPVTIARILEIPITWVYETADTEIAGEDITDELSPFETINS